MKLESFEKATAIKEQIDRLQKLDAVLVQASRGRNTLAAIERDCYDKITVIAEQCLSEEMLVAFRNVIGVQVSNLKNAFESL